jgi:ribosomal protein L11 methyltransferase
VARQNAELNSLGPQVEVRHGEAAAIAERFSLVLANILADPLVRMAGALLARLRPGGQLILSGLLGAEVNQVASAYDTAGATLRGFERDGEWALLSFAARGQEQAGG